MASLGNFRLTEKAVSSVKVSRSKNGSKRDGMEILTAAIL
jgi:hypothetical protein